MNLLLKGGIIGRIISVDATCTSLSDLEKIKGKSLKNKWNSICAWGPTAMLPIFQLLGTKYTSKQITSHLIDKNFDTFTKISFVFSDAVASIKVGKGVKSEGELIVSGTKGYIYVPAPWWKTDYFEVRYENPNDNKRYFYQLDGEGIRMQILRFVKSIEREQFNYSIPKDVSSAITNVIQDFYSESLIKI